MKKFTLSYTAAALLCLASTGALAQELQQLPLQGLPQGLPGQLSGLPDLMSSDQKTMVLEMLQSANLGIAAANSLNSTMTEGTLDQSGYSQKWMQMTQILQASAESGACQVQSKQVPGASGQALGDAFLVNGGNCPINYTDAEQNPNDNMTTYSTSMLSVQDGNYRAMTDVDSLSLNGSASTAAGLDSSSFNVSFMGSGSIHSQTWGNLPVTISGSGVYDLLAQGNTEADISITFPQFVTVLHQSTTIQANIAATTYTLDGMTLTDDEVNTYISPATLPHSTHAKLHFLGLNLR